MKTFDKLFLLAASLFLAPVAALAQQAAPAIPAAQSAPAANAAQGTAAGPANAIGAGAQAAPATPAAQSPFPAAKPVPGIGQPDGRAHLQPQFTPIGIEAAWFHDWILTPVVFAISALVLVLLLAAVVLFRRGRHPVPSRTTHNTTLEIVWTLLPVLILVAIAVPSIRLLAHQYDPPKADLTVKVTGNQWYWTYSYPDNGGFEVVSNMLSDDQAKKSGEPRLLGVDERMVVPSGAVVKLIVTSSDVIHSFGVPAFWVKMDAVPGRLNETWFQVKRTGVYYGQCYELCGARHGFMPIAVEVVTPAQFAAWVASKGGNMPGAAKPTGPDSTAGSPVSNPQSVPVTTAPGGGTSATPAPNVSPGTAAPPATNQSQAQSSRGI
ncbi:MAG TPA: cytochrome c oxidase subunit II [Allosphingosinicella sp.]|jgi:cytochrome c oxidase subunit 2